MRRALSFSCSGETLLGTLDVAGGETGVLIVSGGNEIRVGAHRGMALLAERLAAAGVPVFRYDRRGIGDSSGSNGGFESAEPDLASAVASFRGEVPGLRRIVGFGNCDAASALALFHEAVGLDAVVLSNPWIGGADDDEMPPAAAIRARYAEKLRDPREWLRLMRGGVNLAKLLKGLGRLARAAPQAPDLYARIAAALRGSRRPRTILLAERDNTAVAFHDAWRRDPVPGVTVAILPSASHSFAAAADKDWLFAQILAAAS